MTALTPAEYLALRRAATGETVAATAHALGISRKTLYNERSAAYSKLGVGNDIGAFLALGWLRVPAVPLAWGWVAS